jgi:hypothetical protein
MSFIQVDNVVYDYTVDGPDGDPTMVSCVEQPEIFSRSLIKFLEVIRSAS